MTAVSQSYPNYLGGLNEQPDELKKPGQLVEALNVIPDPVIGLTRRPGFELIEWNDRQGNLLPDKNKKHGAIGIDPEGTWFELDYINPINDDYLYMGCVNQDGSINIFNQDGNQQKILYARDPVIPEKKYSYNNGQLKVIDDNDEVIETVKVETPTDPDVDPDIIDYFKNSADQPLKYCVSKNHIIFTRPTVIPGLAGYKKPNR